MVSSYLKDGKQKLELPNELSWDMTIPGEAGELWGEQKVAGGRVLRTRSDCEESQKGLVRPSKRAVKWQRKFRAGECKVIFMEKAALVH